MPEKNFRKVVLAYSGGLDTTVMLHWLRHRQGYDVVTFTADVGQAEELEGLEEKAKLLGASSSHILDLREEFVRDYVFTAIQANALYEGYYLLGTSLARPVIAKHQLEIARQEEAAYVAHGATGKGNDQVRFELTFYALSPDIQVIAPWRDWEMKSRSDLIAYCKEHSLPVTATLEKPYSTDRNLMHCSHEGGILEDPWAEAPEDIFILTANPLTAPERPETVLVTFEKGIPVAINNRSLDPVALLEEANKLGGVHGIGRVDLVENRFVGMKSRGVYETPGVTLLWHAHRALESITLDREEQHWKEELSLKFSEWTYYGFWFSPEMRLLQKTIRESQENVSGEVKLRLYKGSCIVLGRRSAHSLYSEELATFEKDDVYRQKDAEGFIRLQATRLRVNARLRAGSLTAAAQPSQEGKCKPQPSNDVNKLVPWQNT
ncbi:MAG TPA: argininosuccinate synthase [Acidobacteriota bacterium]|jgi:argininosuccinate synthase|nr:argininosuccinate synthase [Acidobacteriota bacterium]